MGLGSGIRKKPIPDTGSRGSKRHRIPYPGSGTETLHFSKLKSKKESQNSRSQGFSYYFCMMIEGSGSGCGSIPLTNGSGSGSATLRRAVRVQYIRERGTGAGVRRGKWEMGRGKWEMLEVKIGTNQIKALYKCKSIL
jgi:hypothetical protein